MARNEDEEQVQDMLRNGLLIKRRVQDGRGVFPFDCPRYDSLLQVHYKGMLLNDEKTVFYDTRVNNDGRPLEFSVGAVPIGFEICVWSMLPGEIAFVTCAPVYAYDTFPRPARVPEGAHVQWEIELLGFESPKDWTGFNFRSIMDEADKIKFTGNRLFKEGKFELAREKYEKVLREFNHVYPWDDEEGKEFSNARNLLHLNVAACFLKMGECRKSIEACNKVLDANPVHVKAFYRRGMAYMQAGDFDEARSDFQKMTSIDKSSEPEAAVALLKLKQKEQEVEKKARKQFKGLFDKKPGIIADAEIPGTSSRSESDNQNEDDDFSSNGDQAEEQHEATNPPPRMGSFSLWPIGDRVVDALELDRCTIL